MMDFFSAKLFFRRKWLIFALGPVLLLLTPLVLAGEPILLAIGNFLVVKDDHLQPADMIHILGGSFDRVDYGVELYHRAYAPRLFITRGGCNAYKERAMASGARPEDLLPDSPWSTNTHDEVLQLKEYLEDGAPVQSVIIVSSPYHMRRAQWSFKKVLGDRVTLQFAPVPFEMSSLEQRWWTDGRSRKMVVKEYLKILFHFVKYSLG